MTGYAVSRADVDTTQQVTDRTASLVRPHRGPSYTVSVAARNAVGTGAPVTATVEIPDLPAVVPTIVVEPPGAPMTVKAKSGRKGGERPPWSVGAARGQRAHGHGHQLCRDRRRADGSLLRTVGGLAPGSKMYTAKLQKGHHRFLVVARSSAGSSVPSKQSKPVRAR